MKLITPRLTLNELSSIPESLYQNIASQMASQIDDKVIQNTTIVEILNSLNKQSYGIEEALNFLNSDINIWVY